MERAAALVTLSTEINIRSLGDYAVSISKLTGRDAFIRGKLEEGYCFRFLGKQLGVSYQTLINYVKGSDKRHRKRRTGITFRTPSTTRDFAERHAVSICAVRHWLREGRIKGKKVGHRWIIIE